MTDSDGNPIVAGDRIAFVYGIPPVRAEGPIVDRDGELIVLTPDHNPTECRVADLEQHVGIFWKVEP